MKVYCGTDLIEIDRVKKCIEDKKIGEIFVHKIYTPKEIEYCESKKAQKYQHYAARFAAKEAAFKAISDLLKNTDHATWKSFEVINNEQGRPKINLIGIEIKEIENIDLSISHGKDYAIANVTLLRK